MASSPPPKGAHTTLPPPPPPKPNPFSSPSGDKTLKAQVTSHEAEIRRLQKSLSESEAKCEKLFEEKEEWTLTAAVPDQAPASTALARAGKLIGALANSPAARVNKRPRDDHGGPTPLAAPPAPPQLTPSSLLHHSSLSSAPLPPLPPPKPTFEAAGVQTDPTAFRHAWTQTRGVIRSDILQPLRPPPKPCAATGTQTEPAPLPSSTTPTAVAASLPPEAVLGSIFVAPGEMGQRTVEDTEERAFWAEMLRLDLLVRHELKEIARAQQGPQGGH